MEVDTYNKKYAMYYDLFNKKKNYSNESNFLDMIFNKYSKTKVNSILNLGCGTGEHERVLSSRGYKITGIDLSENMIEIAKSKNIPNTEFFVGDMSNFNLNKKFDACIIMFAAIDYLIENSQITSALKSVKEHLKPNGLFIIDCWNALGVLHELPSSRISSAEEGDIQIKRTSFPKLDRTKNLCDVNFKVKIYKKGKLIDSYEENHKVRYFFPDEMKSFLEKSGYEVIKICKSFDLNSEADENAWNMTLISKLD